MKKIICLILAVITCFSLYSCAGNKNNVKTDKTTAPQSQNENVSKDVPAGKSKTLVVYFSATGSTQRAAELIADKLGADLFVIEPKDAYTSDDLNYNDKQSRVCLEHDDESKRNIELKTTTPDNWKDYDTVFIGYPIWWGIAAWPVDSFVKSNDFSNKTVVPFCTSASSSLGESANNLKSESNGGTWLDGMRFSSNEDEKAITDWAESIIK